MAQLLTPQEAVDLAFRDGGYLPAETITPADIAAAEARYLIPVTGEALWQKMIDGEYPDLRSDYAAPAAALAVRLLLQPALDIRAGAGGNDRPAHLHRPAPRPRRAARRPTLAAGPLCVAAGGPLDPPGPPHGRLPRIRSPAEHPPQGADRRGICPPSIIFQRETTAKQPGYLFFGKKSLPLPPQAYMGSARLGCRLSSAQGNTLNFKTL